MVHAANSAGCTDAAADAADEQARGVIAASLETGMRPQI